MNGRHLFKRQYVRLKGWLTLGSIGIMPRLIIAFASVGALAATANLIVENGVAILEHQRNAAMERSALDAQQIVALRESMGRARHAAKSAEVLGAWGDFERAAQEHEDADSRASARHYAQARTMLESALGKYLQETGPEQSQLPRLVAEHKISADRLVQSRRVRRELLTRYSGLLTGMDMRVRTSIEQGWKITTRATAREALLEVRAQLDVVRAAFASRGSFDGRELDTSPLAGAERTLAATLRDRQTALRRSPGADWYHVMTGDVQALTTTRVALFRNEERRMSAVDAFARESRKLAALLPARFPEAPPEASPRKSSTTPASVADRVGPEPLAGGVGERRGTRGAALSLHRDNLQHRAAGTAAAGRHQPPGARRERPRGGHAAASASWTRSLRPSIRWRSSSPRRVPRRVRRSSASKPRSRSARASCRSSQSRIRSRASPTAGSCLSHSTRRSIGRASPASASACSSSTSTTSRRSTTAWDIPTGIVC